MVKLKASSLVEAVVSLTLVSLVITMTLWLIVKKPMHGSQERMDVQRITDSIYQSTLLDANQWENETLQVGSYAIEKEIYHTTTNQYEMTLTIQGLSKQQKKYILTP